MTAADDAPLPPRRMPRLARWLLVALVAAMGLLGVATLALRHPILAIRLAMEESPVVLPVPVEGVRSRDVRDSWKAPRSGGREHHGIDIFAKRGTPVRSATRGIVMRVGTNRLGGQVVWVLGPGAELHYYAHLDRFGNFRRGAVVAAGDVLGFVGDTGNAKGTPCHLHYGIYHAQGGATNPYPRLVTPDR